MSYAFSLAILFIMLVMTAATLAADKDILDIVKENPLPYPTARSADSAIAKAADGLADVEHPWTVPRMIDLYRQQHSLLWERPRQEGPDWIKERQRYEHLATLLAASRDPRAAVLLMKTVEDQPHYPCYSIVDGLTLYFMRDAKYRQIEPRIDRSMGMTVFHNEKLDLVDWWKLNKEQIEVAAKAISN